MIGSKMFPLKQEVLLLEKMDQKYKDTRVTNERRTPASLEESQCLSDQLLSLSTEEDLGRQMGSLSLGGKDRDVVDEGRLLSKAPEGGLSEKQEVVDEGKSKGAGHEGGPECAVKQKETGRPAESAGEGPEWQSAMERLTLQDGIGQPGAANSHDDNTSSAKDPAASDSYTKGFTGTDSGHWDVNKKPDKSDQRQQRPGESKSAYLVRLLDKRKDLFSEVADIQTHSSSASQTSHSNSNRSDDEKRAAGEKDKAKLSDTDGGKRGSEQTQHGGAHSGQQAAAGSPSTEKQGRGSTASKSNKQSGSKRTQSSNKPSKAASASPQRHASPLDLVCQIITQWVSPETLTYLGLSSEQGQGGNEGQGHSTDAFHKDPEMQRKYQDLCQRLAGQEKDFVDVLGEEEVEGEEGRGQKKPLPHFKELKKQAEEYQSKVEQFLSGSTGPRKKSREVGLKDEMDA